MNGKELELLMETHRKLQRSLDVQVMISHEQVYKVVVEDLISKRNAPTNHKKEHFDVVLRYYLTEDEFERYVLRGEKIVL